MANKNDSPLFELNGKPALKDSLPLALQHLVAMIVGAITPCIIVAGIAEMNEQQSILLIQSGLFISGTDTLVQLFVPFGRIGSGLPIIMGVSFSFIPTITAIVAQYDIATFFGAQLCSSIAVIVFGIFIGKLRKFFPTIVAGTVVFVIGLSLYSVAINYMAGGQGSPDYGSWQNWLLAFITLGVVLFLNFFTKGIWQLASILIGVIVGYVIALCMGMVDFSPVQSAEAFAIPELLPFGMEFEPSAIIMMTIVFIVNSIKGIGDVSATTNGAMGRLPTDKELGGLCIGNGFSTAIGSFCGGMPTSTFSQNVGIVITTRVISCFVLALTAIFILLASLFPGFGGALRTIPQCVLGGATLSVFASITMTGISMIASLKLTPRVMTIVGVSIALGVGISLVPESLADAPGWAQTIFGSAVIDATIVAVVLNLLLPKTADDLENDKKEAAAH